MVSSLFANVSLKPFFIRITGKYKHLNNERCTRQRNAGQLLGQVPLHLPHFRADLWVAVSGSFVHACFGIFLSLNLLQVFKCRSVTVLTVDLNRSMSMTRPAILTLLEE